jgi:hypothetical protein
VRPSQGLASSRLVRLYIEADGPRKPRLLGSPHRLRPILITIAKCYDECQGLTWCDSRSLPDERVARLFGSSYCPGNLWNLLRAKPVTKSMKDCRERHHLRQPHLNKHSIYWDEETGQSLQVLNSSTATGCVSIIGPWQIVCPMTPEIPPPPPNCIGDWVFILDSGPDGRSSWVV